MHSSNQKKCILPTFLILAFDLISWFSICITHSASCLARPNLLLPLVHSNFHVVINSLFNAQCQNHFDFYPLLSCNNFSWFILEAFNYRIWSDEEKYKTFSINNHLKDWCGFFEHWKSSSFFFFLAY